MKKKALIILGFGLVCIMLVLFSKSSLENDVYITEVMASNKSVIADENGNFSDWIELYNPTENEINLKGYMISDDPYNIELYTFPSVSIEPGEYLVIFADRTKSYNAEEKAIHVPFSISSNGEAISLYNPKGRLRNSIRTTKLEKNQSMGLNENGKLTVLDVPTPGYANDGQLENAKTASVRSAKELLINEYSTSSTQTLMDEDGDFVSWVELYNNSEKDFDLTGCSLTDDEQNKKKWVFPAAKIAAGEYLVIYLSGKTNEYSEGGRLHANFKLSGEEDMLYLNDKKGKTIDSVQVYELSSNLTCGRPESDLTKLAFFAKATPGQKNNLTAFETIGSARKTANKSVSITEAAAVNTTVAQSAQNEYFDYVELHNNTDKAINLKDYKLSDSSGTESFKQLPDKTLEAGEYIAIYCGDSDRVSSVTGNIYVSFGLNRYGETVYLADSNYVIVDSLQYGRLSSGYCSGKDINGSDEVVYYSSLTPGKKNPSKTLKSALANPVFSEQSTYLEANSKIEITASNGEIYYTTDGSEPTASSRKYTEPITIKKTTSIRAKVFKNGYIPSDSVSATYIVGRKHTLPVVFLTTDDKNLYDYETGIFADEAGKSSVYPYLGANYWQDWERPVNFEYMTADGVSQLEFDAGIKVFGQYSRVLEQKSVSINLRDKYGLKEVCYPFFEGNEVNVFSSLVLRNSGQDFTQSHIRDAFCVEVIKGCMDIDYMDYQPVVTYINGEYYGIYDLREKLDEDYLANHRGIDSNNVDLIKGNSIVQSGSMDNYNALLTYIKTHDMTTDESYEYVSSQIDIDELINYWLCESFFTNTDTGNIRFYRENTDGSKWRWLLYDLDWALYPLTYTKNYIDNYLNPNGHGVGNMFNTTIMTGLMKNQKFRTRVLEIHSEQLKTTFSTERMLKIFDELIDEIKPEMKYHCKRWSSVSYEKWESSVSQLREIISKKRDIFIEDMKESFNMTNTEIEKYLG